MSEDNKTPNNKPSPCWNRRRKIVYATLFFCAFTVGYVVWGGEDTRLNETVVNGCLILAGSTIGSYVFGATWDDKR